MDDGTFKIGALAHKTELVGFLVPWYLVVTDSQPLQNRPIHNVVGLTGSPSEFEAPDSASSDRVFTFRGVFLKFVTLLIVSRYVTCATGGVVMVRSYVSVFVEEHRLFNADVRSFPAGSTH